MVMMYFFAVDVEQWIASAQAESLRVEEDKMSRSSSQVSIRSDSTGKVCIYFEIQYCIASRSTLSA